MDDAANEEILQNCKLSQQFSQDASQDVDEELADVSLETPVDLVFIPSSIDRSTILGGASYSHYSPVPLRIEEDGDAPCVLGVDEAGRGPVLGIMTFVAEATTLLLTQMLGPMVYGVFYMPLDTERRLLKDTHHFDDSKALTPAVRSRLMKVLSTQGTDLQETCGWATRVMSARDIGADMLRASGTYNLNNQAMDATIDLINGVCSRGINIREVYVDTIGRPETYQKKLERVFPTMRITVAKKADSLYPCVSAASVCAKVTRDAALEVSYESYQAQDTELTATPSFAGWGSGYPSDARCTSWLKQNMDPLFGWGAECRFSWGTAKELLECENASCIVHWPEEADEDDSLKVTSFFGPSKDGSTESRGELATWFGSPVTEQVF